MRTLAPPCRQPADSDREAIRPSASCVAEIEQRGAHRAGRPGEGHERAGGGEGFARDERVALITGDYSSARSHDHDVEGSRVLAFGHPFYNVRAGKLRDDAAYVHDVLPSLNSSMYLASLGKSSARCSRTGPPP